MPYTYEFAHPGEKNHVGAHEQQLIVCGLPVTESWIIITIIVIICL